MTTLTVMKARIASEVRRANITTQIANAITTAIEAYQTKPWAFQQSRTVTFPTVAGTEHYSSGLSTLVRIDWVKLTEGTTVYTLEPMMPEEREDLSDTGTASGQPFAYSWYAGQMGFYPVPDAVYTIRVAGIYRVAAPADADVGNPWMTTAERLIRSRAKWELAMHVIHDDAMAQRMAETTKDAEAYMLRQSNDLIRGDSRVLPFC